jgi:polyisoprenoid-binding protein YceI
MSSPPSTTPKTRHWKRWLIGGAVVVLLLVVGGPFVYIHFIEGDPPPPLSVSSASTTTTSGSSGSSAAPATIDGTWKVATGSTAGYRVKETLFGQSTTAVGRTSTITGTIAISGTQVTTGQFSVDMTTVKSDQSGRDDQFQTRIMDTSSFPKATFELTEPIDLGSVPADGQTVTKSATGKLTLHGATKPVTFDVQAKRSGQTIAVSGSIPITFADYGIDNPTGGPATVGDTGTLEFLLNFSQG